MLSRKDSILRREEAEKKEGCETKKFKGQRKLNCSLCPRSWDTELIPAFVQFPLCNDCSLYNLDIVLFADSMPSETIYVELKIIAEKIIMKRQHQHTRVLCNSYSSFFHFSLTPPLAFVNSICRTNSHRRTSSAPDNISTHALNNF